MLRPMLKTGQILPSVRLSKLLTGAWRKATSFNFRLQVSLLERRKEGMNARKLTLAVLTILLSGCATTAKYEAKVASWEDKDSNALVRAWGQPDAVEKLSTGNRMFVYARLRHVPVAYGSDRVIAKHGANKAGRNVASSASTESALDGEVYIRCATYFEVSPKDKVVSTLFRGDECKTKE